MLRVVLFLLMNTLDRMLRLVWLELTVIQTVSSVLTMRKCHLKMTASLLKQVTKDSLAIIGTFQANFRYLMYVSFHGIPAFVLGCTLLLYAGID